MQNFGNETKMQQLIVYLLFVDYYSEEKNCNTLSFRITCNVSLLYGIPNTYLCPCRWKSASQYSMFEFGIFPI